MKILAISDIHAGEHAKAKELCPQLDAQKNCSVDTISGPLAEALKKDGHIIEALLVPGDISNRAEPDEYFAAGKAVEQLLNGLLKVGVEPAMHLAFAPGNHDVLWSFLKPATDINKIWHSSRYLGLNAQGHIFNEALKNAASPKPFPKLSHDRLISWSIGSIYCISYNSAIDDGPEVEVHNGKYRPSDDGEIKLLSAKAPKDSIKIFMIHHHPYQYREPDPDASDYSILSNSEALIELLHQENFDIYLHGHKHEPHFKEEIHSSGHRLCIFGCGSFSAKLPPKWEGLVLNSAHIIDIEGRCSDSGGIYGSITTYVHCGNGKWSAPEYAFTKFSPVSLFGRTAINDSYVEHFISICPDGIKRVLLDTVMAETNFKYLSAHEKGLFLDQIRKRRGYVPMFDPRVNGSWINVMLEIP